MHDVTVCSTTGESGESSKRRRKKEKKEAEAADEATKVEAKEEAPAEEEESEVRGSRIQAARGSIRLAPEGEAVAAGSTAE